MRPYFSEHRPSTILVLTPQSSIFSTRMPQCIFRFMIFLFYEKNAWPVRRVAQSSPLRCCPHSKALTTVLSMRTLAVACRTARVPDGKPNVSSGFLLKTGDVLSAAHTGQTNGTRRRQGARYTKSIGTVSLIFLLKKCIVVAQGGLLVSGP